MTSDKSLRNRRLQPSNPQVAGSIPAGRILQRHHGNVMPRFRISSLLVLTAIVATVLLLGLKLPVHQTYVHTTATANAGVPRTDADTITKKRPPSLREAALRIVVWLPWAIAAW